MPIDGLHAARRGIRNILVVVAAGLASPLWIPVWIARVFRAGDGVFLTCSQLLSMIPGLLEVFLRRGFCVMCLESFAWDCGMGFGSWFSHPQVRVGARVYIGARCTMGMCEIGDDVLIGSNVDILSGRHTHHTDDLDTPIRDQGETFVKVRIGRNAWIGNSSVIMADVGDNCVIGAGSVVVKPIPPNSIAVGNPAVVRKTRT